MQLSEEELKQITKLAKLSFKPDEIEIIMEFEIMSLSEQLDNPNSKAYKAFHSGRLTAEYELRKSIAQSAENGSHPAQLQMLKFQNQLKANINE